MTMLANQKGARREISSPTWTILVRAAAFSILMLLIALVATSAAGYFDMQPQAEAAQLLLGP